MDIRNKDTRQKLEEDIRSYVLHVGEATVMSERTDEQVVRGWLDRQAAITRAELQGCPGYDADRHYCKYHANDFELTREQVCELKREVSRLERERDEKYVALPLDADGVPIRLHDKMEAVDGMTFPAKSLHFTSEDWDDGSWWVNEARFDPKGLRHHHGRTVEDVLQTMLEQAVGYSEAHTTVALDAIVKYADELRELMEVES